MHPDAEHEPSRLVRAVGGRLPELLAAALALAAGWWVWPPLAWLALAPLAWIAIDPARRQVRAMLARHRTKGRRIDPAPTHATQERQAQSA